MATPKAYRAQHEAQAAYDRVFELSRKSSPHIDNAMWEYELACRQYVRVLKEAIEDVLILYNDNPLKGGSYHHYQEQKLMELERMLKEIQDPDHDPFNRTEPDNRLSPNIDRRTLSIQARKDAPPEDVAEALPSDPAEPEDGRPAD